MFIPKFTTDKVVRRLRWVVLFVMLIDAVVTLVGQPASFWHNPSVANEGEPIVRFFLSRGVIPYVVVGLIYVAGSLVLASILPRALGLTLLFFLLLEHFGGALSWFLYRYDLGIRFQDAFELSFAALIAHSICLPETKHE